MKESASHRADAAERLSLPTRKGHARPELHHVAAFFSLQLPLAAVTEGSDALRGSHSRRSSACGSANHAIAGGGLLRGHICGHVDTTANA